MKIWLDDTRVAPEGWTWVKTAQEAIDLLQSGGVDEISLDHDLGLGVGTGYDVAKWIEERVYNDSLYHPPLVRIHTANPVGRKNIEKAVEFIAKTIMRRSMN